MTLGLPEPLEEILDKITPLHFTIGLSVLSVVTISVCTTCAYSTDDPLPPPGPRPVQAVQSTIKNARYMPTFFRSLIEDDSKKLGLPPISPSMLAMPNALRKEFSGRQRLGIKKRNNTLETQTLLLQLQRRKLWIGSEGQSVRARHLVLRITNRSDRYLAYRVLTEMTSRGRPLDTPGPCTHKSAIAHNGIALKPNETIERTECLALKRGRLYIRAVEVLELRPLGYHYVSRLEPKALQLSARSTEGHQPSLLPLCRRLPWQLLKNGIANGHFRWSDVADFYSRHSCDEYTFFYSYRWSSRGPGELPLRPPSSGAPG